MVLWEPVGRTIAIGDLRAGEREFRPGQGVQRDIVQHLLRIGLRGWSSGRHRRCEAVGPWWRRIGCLHRCGSPGYSPERQSRCGYQPFFHLPLLVSKSPPSSQHQPSAASAGSISNRGPAPTLAAVAAVCFARAPAATPPPRRLPPQRPKQSIAKTQAGSWGRPRKRLDGVLVASNVRCRSTACE